MPRVWIPTSKQIIDILKLHNECVASGLEIEGISDESRLEGEPRTQIGLDFVADPEASDLATAQAVIDAHDGEDSYAERQRKAKDSFANVPDWARVTEEQALTVFDSNVLTPLQDAPEITAQNIIAVMNQLIPILRFQAQVVRALVQFVLAIRNVIWPDLEGS